MNIFSKIFRRSMESTPSNMEEGDAKELHEPTTQVNRMKIPDSIGEAIRYIVEERGITFIKERGFINMLDDLHVLKSIPASKNILRNLQSDSAYLGSAELIFSHRQRVADVIPHNDEVD